MEGTDMAAEKPSIGPDEASAIKPLAGDPAIPSPTPDSAPIPDPLAPIADSDPQTTPLQEQLLPQAPQAGRSFVPRDAFVSLRGFLLSKEQREAGRLQRERERELDVALDIQALRRLVDINQGIRRNPVADRPDMTVDLTALQDSYTKSDPKSKKRIKREISDQRKRLQHRTIATILDDVRTLRMDTGDSPEEASGVANTLIGSFIEGRRTFDQIGRESQIAVVQNALDHRNSLLVANGMNYIYLLTGVSAEVGIGDDEISALRRRFAEGDEDEKLAIASETRARAEAAIDDVMEANIPRLRAIEAREGEVFALSDRIEEEFEDAPLTERARLLERVLDRKLDLSIKYLPDIYRLRTLLYQTPHGQTDEIVELGTDRERLLAEVRVIMDKLISSSYPVSLNEPNDDDLLKNADKMWAAYYKDTSITRIANLVLLLRTDVS